MAICDNNNAISSYTLELPIGLQIYTITGKDQSLYIHRLYQNIWKKKKRNKLGTLIQTISICNQDIGIEFCIETCAKLIMENREREAMKALHQNVAKKEYCLYLGVLKVDTVMQTKMNEKIRKE